MTPHFQQDGISLYHGDSLGVLRRLADRSARMCVTSPPYWGLRDYRADGQIGIEDTPAEFVERLVDVFREVRRVLTDDGTLWLNIGDSYNAYNGGAGPSSKLSKRQSAERPKLESGYSLRDKSLKPKDLVGVPWLHAFALRADGWYLRQDIIWHKPNPMPESIEDRCTKAHEYIFLLSKSERYFYNAQAIAEPVSEVTKERYAYAFGGAKNESGNTPAESGIDMRTRPVGFRDTPETRNRRSVWTITIKPYKGAHFATFPPELPEACILAGSAPGDVVIDPFNGSGTTGAAAQKHGRRYVGIDLNIDYLALSIDRFRQYVIFPAEGAQ